MCYDIPPPFKELHVVGLVRPLHKSDTAGPFIRLDCLGNGDACSWACMRGTGMFWNHCCARLQMRTALTETCVYHIGHSSIGPELRRQAIHSSSNICRAVLSVEARLHCQLLVWRENNVSAEVANVGKSCMQVRI